MMPRPKADKFSYFQSKKYPSTMKVKYPRYLDNNSRTAFMIELTKAFASYDLEKIESHLTANVTWVLVGDQPIRGRTEFITALHEMKGEPVVKLNISHAITKYLRGAIHGEMEMADHTKYGFADFYTFSDGKDMVAEITSFVQKMKCTTHENNMIHDV